MARYELSFALSPDGHPQGMQDWGLSLIKTTPHLYQHITKNLPTLHALEGF
jgi:hypothetical protein